jgi:hypothetical protein
LVSSTLAVCSFKRFGDSSVDFALGARRIAKSLGNAKQAAVLTSVNNIVFIKFIGNQPL